MRNKLIVSLILISILFPLFLLISGTRILFSEQRVNPGDLYAVQDYGNLGEMNQSSLVCKYFTGRSVITSVFWYSSNNFMGRDQCPFFVFQD
jgi:hypothetical protein